MSAAILNKMPVEPTNLAGQQVPIFPTFSCFFGLLPIFSYFFKKFLIFPIFLGFYRVQGYILKYLR